MSSELEELGEYVLIVLEKMKATEKRVQKLEDSVDSINKVIEEATEEAVPTENTPQTPPPMPLHFWLPLNAAKWAGIITAIYSVANIVARKHLIALDSNLAAPWAFWITLESILAGISIAVVIGIEVFFSWRKRRTRRPTINTIKEIEETQPEAKETIIQAPMIKEKAK